MTADRRASGRRGARHPQAFRRNARAEGRRSRRAQGRGGGDHRPERRRQEHLPAHAQLSSTGPTPARSGSTARRWARPSPAAAGPRCPMRACRAQRRQIGMVFQQFNLFSHMTALENVMCGPGAGAEDTARPTALADAQATAGAGRPRRQGSLLSRTALGRPAAARGDRPRAGDASDGDAVRRADLGARSRDGGRGAAGHAGPVASRA